MVHRIKARMLNIPGSHPALAARLMLERKGIPYSRIDLVPGMSRAIVRAAGFKGTRVPALWLDGERVQGSRAIARKLDEVVPDPPLFPGDPDERLRVEEAERWGDDELQPVIRTVLWWVMKRGPKHGASYLEGARLGVPLKLAALGTPLVARLAGRLNAADDDNVRGLLARLPGLLAHADELVEQGVIGGGEQNAADYQVLTSIRLALTLDDLRPAIERSLAGEAALRAIPHYPGHLPPALPPEWLAGLRERAAATPA